MFGGWLRWLLAAPALVSEMHWLSYIVFVVIAISFCEFFGDYIKLFSCKWPCFVIKHKTYEPLHAMILADTHLLGPLKGHWLDKFYREWHMKRTFQVAMQLHKPDIVFVLGDLFDEGDMVNHDEFKKFVIRFQNLFCTPPSVPVISAVGNHDIGFHYKMHSYFVDRFETYFNNTGVEMYTIRGNHFVLINSMAMENDGCEFCDTAINELQKVANKFICMKNPKDCQNSKILNELKEYSRPIVLQHFPTYRVSDKSCREHDAPNIEKYRENWEVLSKKSTDWLGNLLHPRLSFAGHTHNYCYNINRWGVEEYTVASFSWRNKINPSFLMVSLTPNSHEVFKCDMLQEQLVYNTYKVFLIILLSIFILDCIKILRSLVFKSNAKTKVV